MHAAGTSFGSFGVGALVPVLPWFVLSGTAAIATSIIFGAIAAVVIGVLLARYTERPVVPSALRQLGIAALAAGVPYLIGSAVGVTIT